MAFSHVIYIITRRGVTLIFFTLILTHSCP